MGNQSPMEIAWLASALSMIVLALVILFLWYRGPTDIRRRALGRGVVFDSLGYLAMAIVMAISGCWCLYGVLSGVGPEEMDPLNKGILVMGFAVVHASWGIPMTINPRDFIGRYAKVGVDLSVENPRDVRIVLAIGIALSAVSVLLTVLWALAILAR